MGTDITDWVEAYSCGTDYEADLVCARLQDADIPAVILNQRDHAFNFTFGYLAKVKVYVPKSFKESATNLLRLQPLPDEELSHQPPEKK